MGRSGTLRIKLIKLLTDFVTLIFANDLESNEQTTASLSFVFATLSIGTTIDVIATDKLARIRNITRTDRNPIIPITKRWGIDEPFVFKSMYNHRKRKIMK